ncbi:MAG: DUF2637 domain-containing protein [Acidimicrobiales bacterium]
MTDEALHSIRRRVHLALAAALLASVAANVLAAEPTVTARAVAAWPPVALMLVVDVLGRAPTARGWTGRVAVAAAGLVALVAGLASFSHVRAVALEVGESELVAWVLPLSVDGLAVVCSVALVEINRRLNATSIDDAAADAWTAIAEHLEPTVVTPVERTPKDRSTEPAGPSTNGHRPLVLFNSSPPDSPGS